MKRFFIHNETKFEGGKFKGINPECTNVLAAIMEPDAKSEPVGFTEIDECDFLGMKDAGMSQLYLAAGVRVFGRL